MKKNNIDLKTGFLMPQPSMSIVVTAMASYKTRVTR